MRCPVCDEAISIKVHVTPCLSLWNAIKLRVAPKETRVVLLEELCLKISEMAMNRLHPENDSAST